MDTQTQGTQQSTGFQPSFRKKRDYIKGATLAVAGTTLAVAGTGLVIGLANRRNIKAMNETAGDLAAGVQEQIKGLKKAQERLEVMEESLIDATRHLNNVELTGNTLIEAIGMLSGPVLNIAAGVDVKMAEEARGKMNVILNKALAQQQAQQQQNQQQNQQQTEKRASGKRKNKK